MNVLCTYKIHFMHFVAVIIKSTTFLLVVTLQILHDGHEQALHGVCIGILLVVNG